jgi:zinc protease
MNRLREVAMSFLQRLSFFLFIFTISATACDRVDDPDAFLRPERFTLSNGLQVVLLPNTRAPILSVNLYYKVGAIHETKGKTGLAHFWEHLYNENTNDNFPGTHNASTSREETVYEHTIPRAYLEDVLATEAYLMQRKTVNPAVFERERKVVLNELFDNQNSSAERLSELSDRVFYRSLPYERPLIGEAEDIEQITITDLQDFFKQYYGPNNAILFVAGDVTLTILRPLVEKYFGQISPKQIPALILDQQLPELESNQHLEPLCDEQVGLPKFTRKFRTKSAPYRMAKEDAVMDVIEELLEDQAFDLYVNLVKDEAGPFSSFSVDGDSLPMGHGCFSFSAALKDGAFSRELAESMFDQQLRRMVRDGIKIEDIERAKKKVMNFKHVMMDDPLAAAEAYGEALASGYPFEDIEQSFRNAERVTPEEVNAMLRIVFDTDKHLTTWLLPADGNDDSASQASEEEEDEADVKGHVQPDPKLKFYTIKPVDPQASNSIAINEVLAPRSQVRAFIAPYAHTPLVALGFAFRAGNAYTPKGKEGIAVLLNSMLLKGCGIYDERALLNAMTMAGLELSFNAASDHVSGKVTFPKSSMREAVRLLRLIFNEPSFDEAILKRAKLELIHNDEASKNDENNALSTRQLETLYGAHPYNRSLSTLMQSTRNITSQDLRDYMRDRFCWDNLIVSLAGAVNDQEAGILVDEVFGLLKPKAIPVAIENIVPNCDGTIVLIDRSLPQSLIRFCQHGLPTTHPDFLKLVLLMDIVGGHELTSRLYTEIRDGHGLVYGIGCNADSSLHANLISGSTSTNPQNVPTVIELIRQTWVKVCKDGITAEELDHAKRQFIETMAFNFKDSASARDFLLAKLMSGRQLSDIKQFAQTVDSTTLQDMQQVARKYLKPKQLTFFVAGPNINDEEDDEEEGGSDQGDE